VRYREAMRESKPKQEPTGRDGKDRKSVRLAEALRANLARRKAQARARKAETPGQKNQGQ
jgi:hypothetical protein